MNRLKYTHRKKKIPNDIIVQWKINFDVIYRDARNLNVFNFSRKRLRAAIDEFGCLFFFSIVYISLECHQQPGRSHIVAHKSFSPLGLMISYTLSVFYTRVDTTTTTRVNGTMWMKAFRALTYTTNPSCLAGFYFYIDIAQIERAKETIRKLYCKIIFQTKIANVLYICPLKKYIYFA